MKTSSSSSKYGVGGIDRISEVEGSDSEYGSRHSPVVVPSAGDDTEPEDELLVEPAMIPLPQPGMGIVRARTPGSLSVNTSLGQSSTSRPRRSASLSDALMSESFPRTSSIATDFPI